MGRSDKNQSCLKHFVHALTRPDKMLRLSPTASCMNQYLFVGARELHTSRNKVLKRLFAKNARFRQNIADNTPCARIRLPFNGRKVKFNIRRTRLVQFDTKECQMPIDASTICLSDEDGSLRFLSHASPSI